MSQLSVTFKPDVQKKLRTYAEKHGIGVAEAIRRLVDIGIRMEAYQEQQDADGNAGTFDIPKALNKLEKAATRNMQYLIEVLQFHHQEIAKDMNKEQFDALLNKVRAVSTARSQEIIREM